MTKPAGQGAVNRTADAVPGSDDRRHDCASLRAMRADDWEAIHSVAKLAVVYRYQAWEPNTADQTRNAANLAALEAYNPDLVPPSTSGGSD